MKDITPEQKEQLNNWSIQRDALLGVIAGLNKEKDSLNQKIKELSITSTELDNKIQQSIGRMAELDNTEKLYMDIVDTRLPELESKKTKLEVELNSLSKEVDLLKKEKEDKKRDIEFLKETYESLFNKTGVLREVVEHVKNVNSSNLKDIENSTKLISDKVKEILSISSENLEAHTDILNRIPKMFVELQKKILIRKKI